MIVTASGMSVRVHGHPKPQPRTKGARRGNHTHMYTPASADGWKDCVRLAFAEDRRPTLTGPIRLTIEYIMPRPKSHHIAGSFDRPLKDSAPNWCTQMRKGDIDNLDKATMDAMTDAGVWTDDRLVCCISASKRYIKAGEKPGAIIIVGEVE